MTAQNRTSSNRRDNSTFTCETWQVHLLCDNAVRCCCGRGCYITCWKKRNDS